MDPTQLKELEQNLAIHNSLADQETKKRSLQYLDAFSLRQDVLPCCKSILQNNENYLVLLFAIQTVNNYMRNHWMGIDVKVRTDISVFLCLYISNLPFLSVYSSIIEQFIHQFLLFRAPALLKKSYTQATNKEYISVIRVACKLDATLQKMFWSTDLEPISPSDMEPFFAEGIDKAIVGIEILLAQLEQVSIRDAKLFTASEHRRVQIKYNISSLFRNAQLAHGYLTRFVKGEFSSTSRFYSQLLL